MAALNPSQQSEAANHASPRRARKVDDLVAALGIDAGVSKSQVSRICGELDAAGGELGDRCSGHPQPTDAALNATRGGSVMSTNRHPHRWAGRRRTAALDL